MAEYKDDHERTIEAAKELIKNGKRIVLSGRIRNGKLELDQATLDELARRFPNADEAFVAVNAPFDPVPHAASELS